MDELYTKQQHELVMTNRNTLELTGITRVESFDSQEFLLQTEYGYLGIQGEDLHIQSLDLEQGRVAIEGQIAHLSYLDIKQGMGNKSSSSIWGRLFR
jgi:sporulation protein YabP